MKRLFLAGAIALFGLANAQVNFGIKAGYSLSTAHFKDLQKQPEHKSGIYAGFSTEYKLSKKLSLEGDVLYSNVGFKVDETQINTIYVQNSKGEFVVLDRDDPYYDIKHTYIFNLNTLMLPVSLKYDLTKDLSFLGGVNLGWTFSAVLKTNEEYKMKVNSFQKQNKKYFTDSINKFSVAPFVGVAYNLYKGLTIDARYNYGVTEIYNSSKALKGYNRFLQIGLGYKF